MNLKKIVFVFLCLVTFLKVFAQQKEVSVLVFSKTSGFRHKSIPAGKTWNLTEIQGEILEQSMSLQAKQDVGADVNVNCSGADIT